MLFDNGGIPKAADGPPLDEGTVDAETYRVQGAASRASERSEPANRPSEVAGTAKRPLCAARGKAKVLIDFRVKRIPAACRSFAPKGGTLGALLVQRRPCDSRLFAYQLWLRSFGAGETDDRMSSTPGLSRKGEEPPLGKNPLDEGVHIDASKSL